MQKANFEDREKEREKAKAYQDEMHREAEGTIPRVMPRSAASRLLFVVAMHRVIDQSLRSTQRGETRGNDAGQSCCETQRRRSPSTLVPFVILCFFLFYFCVQLCLTEASHRTVRRFGI